MKSYPIKENPIGSAVSEILRYRQTDRQISCYYIIRIFMYNFYLMESLIYKLMIFALKVLLSCFKYIVDKK